MSDVKRLLDAASPLPWSQDEFDLYLTDAEGEPVHWDLEGLGATWGKDGNPALILHAVNHLPDYEAAVDALDRLLAAAQEMDDGITEHGWAMDAARAALRRLRDEVPA